MEFSSNIIHMHISFYLFIPASLVSCGLQSIVFCDVVFRVLTGNIVFFVYVLLTFIYLRPRMYNYDGRRDMLFRAALTSNQILHIVNITVNVSRSVLESFNTR